MRYETEEDAPGRILTPYAALSSLISAGLLILGALADDQSVCAAFVLVGLVLAWGWPVLLGLPRTRGSSLVLVAGVIAFAAVDLESDSDTGMHWLTVALAACLVLTFLHELARRDGRGSLVVSIAGTSLGLGVLASGAFFYEVMARDGGDLAIIAAAGATLLALLVDLALHRRQHLSEWTLPLGLLLGAALGLVLGLAGDGVWNALLVTGLISAGVSHALRRMLTAQPTGHAQVAQLCVGAACVLVVGFVPYAAMWALIR